MHPPHAAAPLRRRRELLVIGIGAGDPQLVTQQAASALARADVVLQIGKGEAAGDLAAIRTLILEEFAPQNPRVVEVVDPMRSDELPYERAVAQWHAERARRVEDALSDHVDDGEIAAILVWGDPSLYDSTIRVIDAVVAQGRLDIDHSVLPGISSVQLLAARHRLVLNRVGAPVLVTTGRRLRRGLPEGVDDAVVVLDGECAFTGFVGEGFHIWWGAYLGTADEVLRAGPLDAVADEIVATRTEARARKGWVFDTYLLRRDGAG